MRTDEITDDQTQRQAAIREGAKAFAAIILENVSMPNDRVTLLRQLRDFENGAICAIRIGGE